MSHRFYYPTALPSVDTNFMLPDEIFHHAINVLRLRLNDRFELFDGAGRSAVAQLDFIERKTATAKICAFTNDNVESSLSITLAQCLSLGDKMDWTIEKATELGVSNIIPLSSAKTLVKLTSDRAHKKHIHWQRIITSACAQSGRNKLPKLHGVQTLKSFLEEQKFNEYYKLMLHPKGAQTLKSLPQPTHQEVIVLIGPESGFDASEVALAQDYGFINAVLGPRVLRTETAGLATIASIQMLWGDF